MKHEIFAYSSVRGSIHEKNNTENQDSYIIKRYSFGTILVVADGLGSKKHAAWGAKSACKAVCKAVQIWNDYSYRDIRLLLPLIHSLWFMEIYPYTYRECACTCLFALIHKDGNVYVGQLGDGSIYVDIDGNLSLVHEKEEDFSNLTACLGGSSLDKWVVRSYRLKTYARIILMTDGISESLVPEKKIDFVNRIWKSIIGIQSLNKRNNYIFQLINEWEQNNAGDDRTLLSYEIIKG